MSFDINATLAAMAEAAAGTAAKGKAEVLANAREFFQDRKVRLERLTNRLKHREIDEALFKDCIEEEKKQFAAELISAKIIAAATVQAAINAAFSVLEKAAKALLP